MLLILSPRFRNGFLELPSFGDMFSLFRVKLLSCDVAVAARDFCMSVALVVRSAFCDDTDNNAPFLR